LIKAESNSQFAKIEPIIREQGYQFLATLAADRTPIKREESVDIEEPILSVTKLNKHFGGVTAVRDINFEVKTGEALGLMGPNGAGKSTLINLISGEFKPDSGTIKFEGRNITGLAPHKICHLGIARTYQIPQPFVNLTALQNTTVAAEYGRGLGKAAAEKEALKLLDLTELTERKDVFARDLASITLKRLELARALATSPKLILLDEVAAGLTEEEIPKILDILLRVREMGITFILIEHVMRVMVKAVDIIIVIDKGEKITEGSPREVMKDRRVIEAYLGEAV
jgi:branched-chain amino acid transport system ATP-binding protein